jgi:inorganic triphosphatase YgiF
MHPRGMRMTEVLERERKWEVDDDFVLSRLDDIVPGSEVEQSTIELTSAYFDTADRDLQAHGLLCVAAKATTTPVGS